MSIQEKILTSIYFALEGFEEDGENQNIQNGNVESKHIKSQFFQFYLNHLEF